MRSTQMKTNCYCLLPKIDQHPNTVKHRIFSRNYTDTLCFKYQSSSYSVKKQKTTKTRKMFFTHILVQFPVEAVKRLRSHTSVASLDCHLKIYLSLIIYQIYHFDVDKLLFLKAVTQVSCPQQVKIFSLNYFTKVTFIFMLAFPKRPVNILV